MSEKTIHIVFQVLNFLSAPHLSERFDLSNDEKLFLLFLAKHKGAKGIFPSLTTLARELGVDYRSARRTLNRVKKKELVFVTLVPGHSSHYTLTLPGLMLSTTQGVHALSNQMIDGASTPSHPGRPRPHTQGVHALRSERENNKKEIKQRGRKKAALPLTVDFEINQKTYELIIELGFTETEADDCLAKFVDYYVEKGNKESDWNVVCRRWVKREIRSAKKKAPEPRSTVKFVNPEHECRRGAESIGTLLHGLAEQAKLHMNGNGGQTNGLGSKGNGEKKGN